jgi:hypothetical protein
LYYYSGKEDDAMAKTGKSLDGATLRFHFDDGPMKGKDYDHTFHDGKVDWGAAGSDRRTTSDGELVRIGDDCYVGSYLGPNGYTLTTAMNLASGELVAFASNGKEWMQQSGTVKRVAAGTERFR